MPAAPVTSAAARQVHQRQPSILTLSSRSAATTPTPPVNKNEGEKPAASLRESNDDHTVRDFLFYLIDPWEMHL